MAPLTCASLRISHLFSDIRLLIITNTKPQICFFTTNTASQQLPGIVTQVVLDPSDFYYLRRLSWRSSHECEKSHSRDSLQAEKFHTFVVISPKFELFAVELWHKLPFVYPLASHCFSGFQLVFSNDNFSHSP